MQSRPATLGSAWSVITTNEGDETECHLVFTDAVLHDKTPKIFVVFTDAEGTEVALKTAQSWAGPLGFQIDLIVLQIVPYPLPVSDPTIPAAFTLDKLRAFTAAMQ